MSTKPDYLTAAEARWEEVRKNPDATAKEILAAEDALRDARLDAEAEGI